MTALAGFVPCAELGIRQIVREAVLEAGEADGLAAGKGVVVAASLEEAHKAVDWMLVDHAMGNAGNRVVIEEFLEGEEASFIVMCDGRNVLSLATSQDHKRLQDGDAGPNTGGMGAYSPAPVVTPQLHARVVRPPSPAASSTHWSSTAPSPARSTPTLSRSLSNERDAPGLQSSMRSPARSAPR